MRFASAVFDLDGTLLNTSQDIMDCLGIAYKKTVGKLPPGFKRTAIGPSLREMIVGLSPGFSDEEVEKVAVAFRECYDASDYPKTKPYPGMPELLADLSMGIDLFVATNKRKFPAIRVLELKKMNFFKDIVTIDYGAGPKIEKTQMLEILIEKWKLEKGKTVYVGDTASDVISAAGAGIESVAVLWGYENGTGIRKAKPGYLVKNSEELRSLLL